MYGLRGSPDASTRVLNDVYLRLSNDAALFHVRLEARRLDELLNLPKIRRAEQDGDFIRVGGAMQQIIPSTWPPRDPSHPSHIPFSIPRSRDICERE
jgi:hypothetical protein